MPKSQTILIAGAGIGGLTAALGLSRAGFKVRVLERAAQLEEAGAGLQLSPNAGRVLADLGLREALDRLASKPEAIVITSTVLGRVARIPLGEVAASRASLPYWVIHRADLQAALLDRVQNSPDIDLQLGATCTGYAERADHIELATSTGNIQGAALIGADGVWSAIRSQLAPDVRPTFSGSIAWRGTVAVTDLPASLRNAEVRLWLGPDAHVVAYPISGDTRVNVVVILSGASDAPGWNIPGERDELLRHFGKRWPSELHALLGSVSDWTRWGLFTLPDGVPWAKGRAALLGDAAHAMLPFAAQGAGMAIEDAAVLARSLSSSPANISQALAAYDAARRKRVARVQKTARQSGWIYHLGGPMALARDISMKILGPSLLQARQNWIYDWRDNASG